MAKKYDTNPLDPDFPERARAKAAASNTAPQTPFKTREFPVSAPSSSITEEETRRLNEADFDAYSFRSSDAPLAYQAPRVAGMNAASSRKVGKVGMPEKWLIALPYLPFHIGLIAGVVQLLVVEKGETKVRFHAAQGLAAHLAIVIVTSILGIIGGLASLGSFIFSIVTTILLIIFAIKAWQGKPVHIESVDDLTNWLEEKIGPVK